jgi:hypothetical protein
MLDWTTSFLSDATIIKLEFEVCQTLSRGTRHMVIRRVLVYYW